MNAHSSLNVLPQDCWALIIDYLSFDDLLSLSTTCKALHASTEHLLYREISWSWKALPLRRLLCLLRTILGRPDLASSVRHLSLLPAKSKWPNPYKTGWVDPGQDMNWSEESSDFQDVTEKAVAIIKKAEFPDAEEWIDALHNGSFHALGAVLISQLPNIVSLRLDFSFVWKGGFPGRMVKHAVFSQNNTHLSSFDSLQVVDYGGNVPRPVKSWMEFDTDYQQPDDFSTPCNRSQFIAWFYLPSIYRLEIWLRDVEELKAAPLDLSHLETLILARSTISEEDVPFFLTRTKNLENLHLGLCHEWETQPLYEHSDCLAEGLMSISDTVERLSISLEYHPCVHGGSDEDFQQEESGAVLHGIFAQFPRLRTLEVPTALLFGFDAEEADLEDCSVLPETLTELVLRIELDNILGFCWGNRDINEFVTSILHNFPDSFPRLRCIISRSHKRYYSQDWPEEDWQMHQTCKESGIDFNIVVDHLGSGLWSQTSPIAKLYK